MFLGLDLQMIVVLLFVLTYIAIIFFYQYKTPIILGASLLLGLIGVISPVEAFKAINWNVMGIYFGMLFVSEAFLYSKMPDILADKIVKKSTKVWVALLGVCFLSGFISIVVENVAVVLIVAPVAFRIAKQFKIHPGPLIVGITASSNLQGVGTIIGDPPSLLLASHSGMNFNDFFSFQGKPGLFFAVQIAAIASLVVLYYFYKKYDGDSIPIKVPKAKSLFPGLALLALVFTLALISFFEYEGTNKVFHALSEFRIGFVCMLFGLTILYWYSKKEPADTWPLLKRLDWDTGVFLIGVFIMVQGLINVDFMTTFAQFLASIVGESTFSAYFLIVWVSVLFSGFVDNVPFIAAMLPVVESLALLMETSPWLYYFGLVIGASVGGNITPVGAAANIVGMGMIKKHGYKMSFFDFVKIGLPFTIVSVLASTLFIWFVFA